MSLASRALPGLVRLREYRREWLRADVVAGVVLAAYLLPAGIGDASLAGLPPEAGLYSCLFAGLVFWLFCSSRHTAITVTSAISLLVGTSLGELAGGDTARYAALAATTALIVAVLGLAAWLLGAGSLVSFISETVMIGFKTGVALHLASTQLPKLFGFKGAHGDFWERAGHFLSHLGETNPASLGLGAAALAVLLLGKWLLPNRPVALLVVVGGIVSVRMFDLSAHGVALLGEIPERLPMPSLPAVHLSDVNALLPLAMAAFLLGAVETAAIGRMFGRKHGYRVDSNQEFLALSAANLAAGLGHGFPVSGGMSQSLVNEGGGARTPFSGLVAAGIMLVVALFLAGLLRDLPQPVLAAIVLMAVTGLFKLSELRRLWRFSRAEFAVAAVSLLGVLGSGLLRGVLIGAVISIVLLLRRASRPRTTELGRVPGTDYFADVLRHPENERLPDVFVFRIRGGAPLLQRRARAGPLPRAPGRAGGGREAGRLLPRHEPGGGPRGHGAARGAARRAPGARDRLPPRGGARRRAGDAPSGRVRRALWPRGREPAGGHRRRGVAPGHKPPSSEGGGLAVTHVIFGAQKTVMFEKGRASTMRSVDDRLPASRNVTPPWAFATHTTHRVWPEGHRFAFSIFDDSDRTTPDGTDAVYRFLADCGIRTTISVWPLRGLHPPKIPGATCEEPDYLAAVKRCQAAGFEVALHNASWETSTRERTLIAFDRFREWFGHDPRSCANHDANEEGIYWGSARLNGWRKHAYSLINGRRYRGHVEGDEHFWGDICRERVRYVRNFVFSDINTLKACPFMPYHDPERPLVQRWFAASYGGEVDSFNRCLSEANQDRLEGEGGACLIYTHFGKGFFGNGRLDPTFVRLMRGLADRKGWFVPVADLLDYLEESNGPVTISARQRAWLERGWMVDQLRRAWRRRWERTWSRTGS